jgi:hypothetical protein
LFGSRAEGVKMSRGCEDEHGTAAVVFMGQGERRRVRC